MKLLALDTATDACSVALNINGEIIERYELLPRLHSRELLPMIDRLFADAGLALTSMDAVAFGCGPGSFTGLRVATAMAQGLAYAVDIPVIAVSTLAALAQQGYRCYGSSNVLSAMDARMDEVYWGVFTEQKQLMVPLQEEQVAAPENVSVSTAAGGQDWLGMGTGWCFRERLAVSVGQCHSAALPHAFDIALLAAADFVQGRLLAAEYAVPVYLRDNVALKKHER